MSSPLHIGCTAWAIIAVAGFVNLTRAPYALDDPAWLFVQWLLFVGASLAATAAALLVPALLVLVIRRTAAGLAWLAAPLLVITAVALFPVHRMWFEAELAHGAVPLAQAVVMEPVPDRERVYERPAVVYGESCCG
ncbi:hypothetical protein DVA67_002830 [Solirubrobacter sp. CPCC 204708]|uniref:Uncharacterized protein n=1 Tax=Solirubrobacter deserti TaxID=2282478 RepID=A0ABT4RRP1_9ACTN|nr:hypothetical protein [Solirubrobacter deserti]MBE2314896.1 hypothetical protein [Solirubrobacter deserti]MDA0141125.1 hypothetical protein [Solirubrobacter deserti]